MKMRKRTAALAAVAAGCVLVISVPVGMANQSPGPAATPRVQQVTHATGSGSTLSLSPWSPRPREVVLVAVASQAWRRLEISVSGNGLRYDLVGVLRNAQGIESLTLFRAQGSAKLVPQRGRVTVGLPGNSGPVVALAVRIKGVPVGNNGANAIRATVGEDGPSEAEGDSADMLTSVQAARSDLVLGFGTNRLRTFVAPAAQRSLASNIAAGSGGGRIAASVWSAPAAATGTTLVGGVHDLTGNSGSDDWAMSALAIRAAGTAGPVPSPTPSAPAPTPAPTPTPMPSASASPAPTASATAPAPSGGCRSPALVACVRPYGASSAWNSPIGASPAIDPRSAQLVRAVADNGLPLTSDPDQYAVPVYAFDGQTPRHSVQMSNYFSSYLDGDDSRVGHGFAATITGVPIPANVSPGVGSDGQVVFWDTATGHEYSFWQFSRDASGNYHATNGYEYNTGEGNGGRFADGLAGRGAGTPYLAGLVRPWEIEQGHIDHALDFAYTSPAHTFVFPASKSDGGGTAGVDLPEGSRLQLNPALGEADFDRFGLNAAAKVMARALQRYGMYTIDNGGSSKVYVEDRQTAGWGPSVSRDMLSGIPWSQFRVIAS